MFDTPHIIKAVRNNLLNHNFVQPDGQEICWKYIKDFYEHDKNYPVRAAPKLTKSHIHPNNFEKMKVKYAFQVFSHTVATGLRLFLRFGAIPATGLATAEFVDLVDKLFDILNSSTLYSTKQFHTAFEGLQNQINFLNNCELYFNNLKITR